MYENTKDKLRFRKYPWPHWITGFCMWSGFGFIMYMAHERILKFDKKGVEYLLLAFLLICGFAFLWAGRTKSTIFDKKTNSLIIRKRNIFCHRRTITKYNLDEMTDVRAVWRGINSGSVNT